VKDRFKKFVQQFVSVSDNEVDASFAYFHEIELQKGDLFAKQGAVCRYVGYLQAGTMRVFYTNDKGEEVSSCFCTEHSFVSAYRSFITQQESNVSVQAIATCQLLVIDYHHLQLLYNQFPFWQQIGRIMAEKEYISMERYASMLNQESAKDKYLRLLREQPQVLLKAQVAHIASYLGVSRRTLSRIRKELRSGGLT
jgi:CRP-like cAMP-binding protein